MGRTDSNAPGYEPDAEDCFDPQLDDFVSKERSYIHFDLPLSEDARSNVRATDQTLIRHAFWPLLAFTKSERRARRDDSGQVCFESKDREIKFGSHADAALMEAYTRRLSHSYEKLLSHSEVSDCILAYRRDVGDNVSQAKELFDQIRSRGNVTAVGMDIRKFFDRISHDVLLRNVKTVLNCERLPDADFKVFCRMTRFEWVDVDALDEALPSERRPHGRLCTSAQFRSIVRSKNKLIKVHPEQYGIPQGTPLSGLYANISLLDFDLEVQKYITSMGGLYRRYSDDIAVVFPNTFDENEIIGAVTAQLSSRSLSIAENKTVISVFSNNDGGVRCSNSFQYLGFVFDGFRVLIRQSSINRYYAKMSRGIKSKVRAARKGGIHRDTMFLRQLFKSYTHFGKRRNFPRYAYRAATIMDSPDIRRQLRGHMKIFKKSLTYYLDRAY